MTNEEQKNLIDQLTQHVGSLTSDLRELMILNRQLISAAAEKPIRLAFTYNQGGEAQHFKFEAPPDALSDADVRDAMAKGRAILETIHAELRNQVGA